MSEVKYKDGDLELLLNDYPVCPYCGFEYVDGYAYGAQEDNEDANLACPSCDKEYGCTTYIEWKYTTYIDKD